jgi:hypothetical protein
MKLLAMVTDPAANDLDALFTPPAPAPSLRREQSPRR